VITSGFLHEKMRGMKFRKACVGARVFTDEYTTLWGSWVAERWHEEIQVMKGTNYQVHGWTH
jgi:hypothetical protein